jgi:hypothetical protein
VNESLTVKAAFESAHAEGSRGDWSQHTSFVLGKLVKRFPAFAEACGVSRITDVDEALCRRFISAKNVDGTDAAQGTMYSRRSHLRMVFVILELGGVVDDDPTRRIRIPNPAVGKPSRPLTEPEDELVRFMLRVGRPSQLASMVCLSDAGGTIAELAALRVSALDLNSGNVQWPGSKGVVPRLGHLDEWSVRQLYEQVARLKGGPGALVLPPGRSELAVRTTAITTRIGKHLRVCGLLASDGITTASLRARCGRRAFEQRQRIDDAARVLGTNLDSAARIIHWDWRTGEIDTRDDAP